MNRGRPARPEPPLVETLRQVAAADGIGALAELVEQRLDHLAGPWALTPDELGQRRACRARFGHYDPTNQHHSTNQLRNIPAGAGFYGRCPTCGTRTYDGWCPRAFCQ